MTTTSALTKEAANLFQPRIDRYRAAINTARDNAKAAAATAKQLEPQADAARDQAARLEVLLELGRAHIDDYKAAQHTAARLERDYRNAKQTARVETVEADELESDLGIALASGDLNRYAELEAEAAPALDTLAQGLALIRNASRDLDALQEEARVIRHRVNRDPRSGRLIDEGARIMPPLALNFWRDLKIGTHAYSNGKIADHGLQMDALLKRLREEGLGDMLERYGL